MGLLHAMSAHATGAVLLAEGDANAALAFLRPAHDAWRHLDARYECARVRVLIGEAGMLGDIDAMTMELDAARTVFAQLGAAPQLARVEQVMRTHFPGDQHGSPR